MTDERHLRVFGDRSELHGFFDDKLTFTEGPPSPAAKARHAEIVKKLEDGYFKDIVHDVTTNGVSDLSALGGSTAELIDQLVDSISADTGRALVALSILQMTVKAISPSQSIRLHKSGSGRGGFSWAEGLPMRNLDSKYFTPVLRTYDLIRLNKYGLFMTRTLAENYPYSVLYKAEPQGRPAAWRSLVEIMEGEDFNAEAALKYTIALLDGKATQFRLLADRVVSGSHVATQSIQTAEQCLDLLVRHIEVSDYAARLMEITMHSMCQAFSACGGGGGAELTPLAQMRQANKKHRNVGDIEWTSGDLIIEAWDAKYGISYLRDELEELAEKLADNHGVELAGFVTDRKPERLSEILPRLKEISLRTGAEIRIIPLNEWVQYMVEQAESEGIREVDLARNWLVAYSETIGLKRRDIAPIDEPSYEWLNTLSDILLEYESS